MSTKHTPGPWLLDSQTIYTLHRFVHVETNRWSATVCPYVGCPTEEAQANAQLISAAPELLEALQWLVKTHPYKQGTIGWSAGSDVRTAITTAKAVIAKALGEQA